MSYFTSYTPCPCCGSPITFDYYRSYDGSLAGDLSCNEDDCELQPYVSMAMKSEEASPDDLLEVLNAKWEAAYKD